MLTYHISARTVRALLFIIAILVPSGAFSQPPATSCPPPPATPTVDEIQALAKAAKDHGFLWKIQEQGHTGYLYGSIHLGKREWMVPGSKTIAALQSSKVIALELDILDPEIQAQLADPSQFGITRVPLPPPLQRRMDTLAAGIDKLVRTRGPVFAAVGTLHMVGAQSVPALLGKMGYTIERVMFDKF